MKSFKQWVEEDYLAEGSTVSATVVEAAICIAYNMHKAGTPWDPSMVDGVASGKPHDAYVAAANQAGVANSPLSAIKKQPEFYMIKATNTLESSGIDYKLGTFLDHSGRGNAGKNFYTKLGFSATDKTPKSDFVGSNKHQISLKQSGEKSGGAQLMSAASDEASGVVAASLLHYENATGKNLADNPKMIKAMKILGETMKNAGSNEMNVEVGKSKKSFVDWYISYEGTIDGQKSRRLEVKDQMSKVDIGRLEDHLKYELKMWRIPDADRAAPGKLLGACYGDKKTKGTPVCGGKGRERNAERNWDWHHGIMKDGAIVTPVTKRDIQTKFAQMYIKSKKADVSVDSIGVSGRYLYADDPKSARTKSVDAALLTDKALKEQVVEVLAVAMESVEWQAQVKEAFNGNDLLKEYIVYEAASGLYKFTGEVSDGKNYRGGEPAVATEIMTFSGAPGGGHLYTDIFAWSKGKAGLVDNLNISYKGSGRTRYIALKILTDSVYNHELPTLMEEFDDIERELLTEGLLGNIYKKVADTAKKVVSAIGNFMKRVYEKVAQRLIGLLNMGANAFMNMMGLAIQGGYVATPNW